MVYRIPVNEVKKTILEVGARVVPQLNFWAPVNLEFLGNSWANMCVSDSCRAYSLKVGAANVGLLLGLIMPDLNSGCLQAISYLWVVEKKFRSKALGLLQRFEKDSKEAGCLAIVTGSVQSMEPEKMFKLYTRLGYFLHSEEYMKRLV